MGRTRYYPDVNVLVHVNVNVPGGGVTLAEGIAWKAWLRIEVMKLLAVSGLITKQWHTNRASVAPK